MPTIILITGVTGVGKTTFAGVLDGLKLLPEHSLTPDKIAKARKIPEQKAVLDLVKEQRGFCYEMKLINQTMQEFFKMVDGRGYTILCHYIGLENDTESIVRAARRAAELGEPPVPATTISGEYRMIPEHIRLLTGKVSRIQFWDNTCGFRVVGDYSEGRLQLASGEKIPRWMLEIRQLIAPEPEKTRKKIDWNKPLFVSERTKQNEKKPDGKRSGNDDHAATQPGQKKGHRDVQRRISVRVAGGSAAGGGEAPESNVQPDGSEADPGLS